MTRETASTSTGGSVARPAPRSREEMLWPSKRITISSSRAAQATMRSSSAGALKAHMDRARVDWQVG